MRGGSAAAKAFKTDTMHVSPTCTLRMHTANGTLTTLEPTAAMAPPTKATPLGGRSVWVDSMLHAMP